MDRMTYDQARAHLDALRDRGTYQATVNDIKAFVSSVSGKGYITDGGPEKVDIKTVLYTGSDPAGLLGAK